MRLHIFPVIIFIFLLTLQLTAVPLVSIDGVAPDLILILLVFYSILNGHIFGAVLGFIFGFLFDLVSGSLIGSSMLAYAISGFVAGYFSNENKREFYIKSYAFPLIVLLCGVISSIVGAFFSSSIELNTNLFLIFLEQGFLPGVYTAVISILAVIFYPKRSFG